jgi:eukaryotic-like serine/threonine-protein kinase
VGPARGRQVAEFLGELVGTPFPDEESAPLRAARQDPRIMGEQIRRSFLDFLAAETMAHPLVLVLDDLHWGDLPTVRFVDAALGHLSDRPFLVLALARPEVHDVFPALWAERGISEMRLSALSDKASARLVRQALGEEVTEQTVFRVVAEAQGNAFYLEELIRAVAEGRGDTLPDTVRSMVEARLSGLPSEARRVARAASVFGEVFWQSGITMLLGRGREQTSRADEWLSILAEREVLVRKVESRFPGEQEFMFRHSLLCEGAYATLIDEDRVRGHRLAARWLGKRGESDPLLVAEHFERGAEPALAGGFYLRAAEQALRGSDIDAARTYAERGLVYAASDELKLALQRLLSLAGEGAGG